MGDIIRNNQLPDRKSIRLRRFDYSQSGYYFLTVCTHNRICRFGDIADGKMHLNAEGEIVAAEWLKSAQIRDEIILDEWIVMPNHFHAIVGICGGGGDDRPVVRTDGNPKGPGSRSVGSLMAGFKSAVTRRINILNNTHGEKLWLQRFWDHIVRNEKELERIRLYIRNNPGNWYTDKLKNIPGRGVKEDMAPYGEEGWMI